MRGLSSGWRSGTSTRESVECNYLGGRCRRKLWQTTLDFDFRNLQVRRIRLAHRRGKNCLGDQQRLHYRQLDGTTNVEAGHRLRGCGRFGCVTHQAGKHVTARRRTELGHQRVNGQHGRNQQQLQAPACREILGTRRLLRQRIKQRMLHSYSPPALRALTFDVPPAESCNKRGNSAASEFNVGAGNPHLADQTISPSDESGQRCFRNRRNACLHTCLSAQKIPAAPEIDKNAESSRRLPGVETILTQIPDAEFRVSGGAGECELKSTAVYSLVVPIESLGVARQRCLYVGHERCFTEPSSDDSLRHERLADPVAMFDWRYVAEGSPRRPGKEVCFFRGRLPAKPVLNVQHHPTTLQAVEAVFVGISRARANHAMSHRLVQLYSYLGLDFVVPVVPFCVEHQSQRDVRGQR